LGGRRLFWLLGVPFSLERSLGASPDLTIEQGSGDYASHVVVKKTDSGEFLLIIQSQNISNRDDRDFSAI
jgi:hypothetical protein